MLPTLVRRLARSAKESAVRAAPLATAAGPSKTRKTWPPDFDQLSPQQQLRFEKKYKRRLQLAGHSPRWEKAIKYAQLATVAAATVYILFFSELSWIDDEYRPSAETRQRVNRMFGILDSDKQHDRRSDAPLPPVSDPKPGPASGTA